MKKFTVFALSLIILFVFNACDEESDDPPPFTNGLMVTIGQNPENAGGIESQKEFTARSYVGCKYEFGYLYTFSAKTAKDEEWTVKFKWDMDDDSLIYLNENVSNEISLKSTTVGDYYINSSSDKADETFIKIKQLDPENILEADFEGFIFKTGGASEPDTLKEGYLITKTFTTPE